MKDNTLLTIKEVAEQSYRKVPYHNFEHALDVSENATNIFNYIKKSRQDLVKMMLSEHKKCSIEELEEVLQIAALFHDAGHLYESKPDDEENSASLAELVLNKINYTDLKIKYVKGLILDTIFRNRGEIKTILGKILADADIASSIGDNYEKFLYNEILLAIEQMDRNTIFSKAFVIKAMKGKIGFVKFLTSITKDENNPFLIKDSNNIFPNFKDNITKLKEEIDSEKYDKWLEIAKKAWKSFYGKDPIFYEGI